MLKFARDRRRYLRWLFKARKRYCLSALNYMVTSNHIHILLRDHGDRDVIPRSMQLIAGRTGQEFNQRKGRKGAYWEDRYHATAVETDEHLVQCLIYIDLNMVRARVVRHPSEWMFSGYNEIQAPRERYALIHYQALMDLLNFKSMEALAKAYRGWVEEAVQKADCFRDERWTQSVALAASSLLRLRKRNSDSRQKAVRWSAEVAASN